MFQLKESTPNETTFYVTLEPDQIVSDDYLSIFVKRWNPSKYTLDEFEEVILYKDTKIKTLKQKVTIFVLQLNPDVTYKQIQSVNLYSYLR